MDRIICKVLKQWKEESHCNSIIQFKYSYSEHTLYIYTNRVGYLIGKAGIYYDKYLSILKNEILNLQGIKFVETSYDYI